MVYGTKKVITKRWHYNLRRLNAVSMVSCNVFNPDPSLQSARLAHDAATLISLRSEPLKATLKRLSREIEVQEKL